MTHDAAADRTRMLTWYRSLFRTTGMLSPEAYAKHLVAAHVFFFGFAVLGFGLFALALWVLITLHGPAWAGWLPILLGFPLCLLALISWAGILIASTIRFVRHMMAARRAQDVP